MEPAQFKATWVNPKLAHLVKDAPIEGAAEASKIPAGPFIPGFVGGSVQRINVVESIPPDGCPPTDHRFFVSETGTVESEGKVCCIVICTACGGTKLFEYFVSPGVKLQK